MKFTTNSLPRDILVVAAITKSSQLNNRPLEFLSVVWQRVILMADLGQKKRRLAASDEIKETVESVEHHAARTSDVPPHVAFAFGTIHRAGIEP